MSYGSDDTMWVVEVMKRIIDVEKKTKGHEFLSVIGNHSAVVTERLQHMPSKPFSIVIGLRLPRQATNSVHPMQPRGAR
jgi:hypothetical protein